jgi:hypothetical protein
MPRNPTVAIAQRIIYAFDTDAQRIVRDNADLPPDHPSVLVLRAYVAAPLAAKQAFWDQLVITLTRAPTLSIHSRRG